MSDSSTFDFGQAVAAIKARIPADKVEGVWGLVLPRMIMKEGLASEKETEGRRRGPAMVCHSLCTKFWLYMWRTNDFPWPEFPQGSEYAYGTVGMEVSLIRAAQAVAIKDPDRAIQMLATNSLEPTVQQVAAASTSNVKEKPVDRSPRESPTAMRRANQDFEICANCGSNNHEAFSCPHPCGSCGKITHRIDTCKVREQSCVCTQFPAHLLKDCTKECSYCPYVTNGVEVHMVKDCPKICHYCLKSSNLSHETKDCPDALTKGKRYCTNCTTHEAAKVYHLPLQCVKNWCAVYACSTPLNCEDHCRECGWDKYDHDMLANCGSGHRCLFTKVWSPMSNIRKMTYLPLLACKANASHLIVADSLARRRVDNRGTIMTALEKGGPFQWPEECPECINEARDTEMATG
ncbi:hypothetical protein F5Y19DRAFT_476012 [Xylariaceae sp. FL1651]|nr:hypothetical protein F5Y19DRAFT_476012 [Xylariaceae sp. FL1651]